MSSSAPQDRRIQSPVSRFRFFNWLALGRRYFLICNRDESPYLLRLLLRGRLPKDAPPPGKKEPRFSIYVHRFLSHDKDRDLHSHPWTWSFSLVLRGGYKESKRDRETGEIRSRIVRPGTINILGNQDFHSIDALRGEECWTLFFCGGKASAWFFLVKGFLVNSKEYLKEKGEVADASGPLPKWVKTCACCGRHFPPPVKYRERESMEPMCWECAELPLAHVYSEEVPYHG